jgi:hypothetical protein
MKKNVGSIDKIVRYLLAVILVVLYFTHVITGLIGIIGLVLAVVFVLTALIGFCPIWWTIKVNTSKKKD